MSENEAQKENERSSSKKENTLKTIMKKTWNGCVAFYGFAKKYVPQLRDVDSAIRSGDAERMVATGLDLGGKYVKGDVGKIWRAADDTYNAVRGNGDIYGKLGNSTDAAKRIAQFAGAKSCHIDVLGRLSSSFYAIQTSKKLEAVVVNGTNNAINKARLMEKDYRTFKPSTLPRPRNVLYQQNLSEANQTPLLSEADGMDMTIPQQADSLHQSEGDHINRLRGCATTSQPTVSAETPAQNKEEPQLTVGNRLNQLRFISAKPPRAQRTSTRTSNMTYRPATHTH